MRIKLFENFETVYYEISQDEFFDTMRSKNLIPLREEFLKKIQKQFKFVQTPEGVSTYIIDKKNLQSKNHIRIHLHITEDEWFYAWIRNYDGFSVVENYYYKADQFDGLEKLINDKINLIYEEDKKI